MKTTWLKHEGVDTHTCEPPVEGRESVRTGDRWACVCGTTYLVGLIHRDAIRETVTMFESSSVKDHGYVVTDLPLPSLEEL